MTVNNIWVTDHQWGGDNAIMIRLEKYMINLLSGVVFILIAAALSSCAYTKVISQDQLNIPKDEARNIGYGRIIVYGVAFEQLDTIMRVNKFGIEPSEEGLIIVSFGSSYAIDFTDIPNVAILEIRMELKRHGYTSLDEFKQNYASAAPMMPDTDFRAVPEDLGDRLFYLALKYNNWGDRSELRLRRW